VGAPTDEPELVSRAARGEIPAYEELVRRYQGIAHRTAYLITGGAAEADDAAQAGFVKAYRALARFDRSRPFRPWLLRIVANEAKNLRRSEGRRAALELRAAMEREEVPTPEMEAAARERREALLAAVNRLAEPDREVIAMRYFLELTEGEMATTLGVAPGTVKSRLARALGRLRAAIEASVGGRADG
jgi:RNA polymerase sigma factor (sigma-70 family)